MEFFASLLLVLGAPASDVAFTFKSLKVDPPLRQVRFEGTKTKTYLVRGDHAWELGARTAGGINLDAMSAAELLAPALKTPEQHAELVDALMPPIDPARASEVLAALHRKPFRDPIARQGVTNDGVFVERVYVQRTASGGLTLVQSHYEFGSRPSRLDRVLYVDDSPSKKTEAAWRPVQPAP